MKKIELQPIEQVQKLVKQPAAKLVPLQDEATMLISQAIDKGVPVETMEKLLAMRRELRQEKAKEEFDRAMARFQSECPTIKKTKEARNDSGKILYRYAPIESIVSQVKEALKRNGFSYTTSMELTPSSVKVAIKVTHSAGHSEITPMEMPFVVRTGIMSETQRVGATVTFVKRYAFLNAFGILTGDEDTDAVQTHDKPQITNPRGIQTTQKSLYQAARENPEEYNKKLAEVKENPITADQESKIRQLSVRKGISMDEIDGKIAATDWKNGKAKTKLSELNEKEARALMEALETKLPDKIKQNSAEIDLEAVDRAIDPAGKFNQK